MKRTEKIEVRLSHEEKQSLSDIAEGEGRTVSDLVRGLIERYVGVTTTRLPQKPRWLLWSGLIAAGLLVGHLGTWAFTKSHNENPAIYTMNFEYMTTDRDRYSISAPIVAQDGYQSALTIPGADGTLKLTATVTESSTELAFVSMSICKEVETNCDIIAQPKLNFNPGEAATIQFGTEGGAEVYIRIVGEKLNSATALKTKKP